VSELAHHTYQTLTHASAPTSRVAEPVADRAANPRDGQPMEALRVKRALGEDVSAISQAWLLTASPLYSGVSSGQPDIQGNI
jgi:hypothetical protein